MIWRTPTLDSPGVGGLRSVFVARAAADIELEVVAPYPVESAIIETFNQAGLDDFEIRRHVEVARNIKTMMAHAHDFLHAIEAIAARRLEVRHIGKDRISNRFE